jgi:heat shock protein HtpX
MNTKNTLKTTALLAALTGLFILVGNGLGGTGGMVVAIIVALFMNGAAYWLSDRLALTMAHARPVSRDEAPVLYQMIEDLAERTRVPVPTVYMIDEPSPNAFATGRNPSHAAVAVTTGIIDLLSPDELYGVLAHEFAHIKHRDILLATVTATIAGAITALAQFFQLAAIFGHNDEEEDGAGMLGSLVMLLIAPIAAMLIQLAISRAREFAADASGARLAGDPLALAGALRKLEMGTWLRPMEINPAASHLFIVHPFAGGGILKLFQTHPPTTERIARLEAMAHTTESRVAGSA